MKKLARALSARIKNLRDAARLSQQEVAERGDLSVSLVGKLEQGKKADPRASTLLALAGALGVTPGKLLDDLFTEPPAKVEKVAAIKAEENGTHPELTEDGKKKKKPAKKKKK